MGGKSLWCKAAGHPERFFFTLGKRPVGTQHSHGDPQQTITISKQHYLSGWHWIFLHCHSFPAKEVDKIFQPLDRRALRRARAAVQYVAAAPGKMLCYAASTSYLWTWPYVRVRCVVCFPCHTHTHTHAHKNCAFWKQTAGCRVRLPTFNGMRWRSLKLWRAWRTHNARQLS